MAWVWMFVNTKQCSIEIELQQCNKTVIALKIVYSRSVGVAWT